MTNAVDPQAGPDPQSATPYPPAGQPPGGYPPAGQPPVAYLPAEPDRFTRFVTRLWERTPRWVAPVAVLGCLGAAMGTVLLIDPARSAPDAAPTCVMKLFTGLACPGCGGTRAVWYLMHGDLAAASRHHLVFVFAVPFLVYLFVAWSAQHMFGRRLPQLSITPKTVSIFLAVWFTFSALRNLPWVPFSWFYV